MSDPDSDLTPAQDDAVRALLASARHTDPTPPEVVARLDAALASLTSDRLETRAPVVTLASRRRRTAGTLLLAAAAVVVAGVGIGQVLPTGSSDESSAGAGDTAMSTEERPAAESGSSPYGAEAEMPDQDGEDGADPKQGDTSSRTTAEAVPSPSNGLVGDLSALSSDTALRPQVRKLRGVVDPTASYPVCPVPDAETDTLVSVTYDGLPGALVFRAPTGSIQRVDVFLCGEREALRTLKLRAP